MQEDRPQPLALTVRQDAIWRLLLAKQTDKHRLADWYLGALYALANPHNPDRQSQAAQSLRELFEKIPLVLTGDTMPKTRRRDRVGRSFAATDPMWVTLPADIQADNIDALFAICKTLEDFAHHGATSRTLADVLDEVDRVLERLLAPVTADNQVEIEAMIAKAGSVTETDIQRTLSLITGSGANFAFFFKNSTDPVWLQPLRKAGVFRKAPAIRTTSEGLTFPFWWPAVYLLKVAARAADEVISIVREVDKTDNPAVLEKFVEISGSIPDPGKTLGLEPLITFYIDQPYHFGIENIDKLLMSWARFGGSALQPAVRLVKHLVTFRDDPQHDEKLAQHKIDPSDWMTSLEPLPKFQDYEYEQLLQNSVRLVAVAAPLETAKVLVEAVAEMLRLSSFEEDRRRQGFIDSSEVWANRVDNPNRPHASAKASLVASLTFACEQVYGRFGTNPEKLQELDRYLRDHGWLVFERIRYHLYARHLTQVRDWIKEAIVQHRNYGAEDYSFEFQHMVRLACEHFGHTLLPEKTWSGIFAKIRSGPDIEEDRRFYGDKFDEAAFLHRVRRLHRRWLRPFQAVLVGDHKAHYEDVVSEGSELTDNDYTPFPIGESKTGASRGPISSAQLGAMDDADLVAHLNEWEDAHRDSTHWWIDIDFSGSARDFRELIEREPDRFLGWGKRWQQLHRPIYLAAAIDAATKRIKQGNHAEIPTWLDVCDWIIQQRDATGSEHQETSDASLDFPSWHSARRAIVDLLGTCVGKDCDVAVAFRSRIFEVLKQACVASDPYLDRSDTRANPQDLMFAAINATRGRALEHLVDYGWWVRRKEGAEASVVDVFSVLELRIKDVPPLTKAEHALLGSCLPRLYALSSDWVRGNIESILPTKRSDVWTCAFGAYLAYNRAHGFLFEVVRPQLEFALQQTDLLGTKDDDRIDAIARLGEHIFAYYLWGRDEALSLLTNFYKRTTAKHWALLFDHVGRLLNKVTPGTLDPQLRCRVEDYFEVRLVAGVSQELQEFTFWLEAEALPVEWRLKALLRVLDITKGRVRSAYTVVKRLSQMLEQNTAIVMEGFKTLTQSVMSGSNAHMPRDEATRILKNGLRHPDRSIQQAAKDAQDNLLRAGLSEYLKPDVSG